MGKAARGRKATEGEAAAMPAKTPAASSPELSALPIPGWHRVPVARHVPAGTVAASVAARGERRMTPEEIEAAVARARAARLAKIRKGGR